MPPSTLPPPILVADEAALRTLVDALAASPVVAVDTESNSLHAYRERVCLIQFDPLELTTSSIPLSSRDLTALAPFFANPGQQKVFHAAEYDVICLRRDYGFEFTNLFDTMSAARTLGWPQVGLAAILETHFGVTMDKTLPARRLETSSADARAAGLRPDGHALPARASGAATRGVDQRGLYDGGAGGIRAPGVAAARERQRTPGSGGVLAGERCPRADRATGRDPASPLCLSGTGGQARGSSSVQGHG